MYRDCVCLYLIGLQFVIQESTVSQLKKHAFVYSAYFHSYVKNSKPYVNSLVVVGAIILYVTVILFGMDENIVSYSTVDALCHARVWLSVIGFSLLFGTIFAKAWRIYYINKHLKSDTMKVHK